MASNKKPCKGRHLWGRWEQDPVACSGVRVCERCGQKEEGERHVWGRWVYDAPDGCRQVRVCGRCQDVERRVHHNWRKKDRETGQPVCDRCGEVDIYESRPCPRCGAHRLVYDGMLVWRSGPRPPRELARKKVRFSHRADVERERCYHCAACGAEFFEDVETRRPHLYQERRQS